MVAVISMLTGIVTSTIVVCAATKSFYGLVSVLYAGVGLLDVVNVGAW